VVTLEYQQNRSNIPPPTLDFPRFPGVTISISISKGKCHLAAKHLGVYGSPSPPLLFSTRGWFTGGGMAFSRGGRSTLVYRDWVGFPFFGWSGQHFICHFFYCFNMLIAFTALQAFVVVVCCFFSSSVAGNTLYNRGLEIL